MNVTLDSASYTSVNSDVIITSLKRRRASSKPCLADVKRMVLRWSFLYLYLGILFRFLVVSSFLSVICLFSVTLSFCVRWSWGMLFSWMWRRVCRLHLQVRNFLKSVATCSLKPTRRRIPEDSNLHFIQVHLPIIVFCFNVICCFHRGSRLMYPLEVRASNTRLSWFLFATFY